MWKVQIFGNSKKSITFRKNFRAVQNLLPSLLLSRNLKKIIKESHFTCFTCVWHCLSPYGKKIISRMSNIRTFQREQTGYWIWGGGNHSKHPQMTSPHHLSSHQNNQTSREQQPGRRMQTEQNLGSRLSFTVHSKLPDPAHWLTPRSALQSIISLTPLITPFSRPTL
jgi:hypothetical protein